MGFMKYFAVSLQAAGFSMLMGAVWAGILYDNSSGTALVGVSGILTLAVGLTFQPKHKPKQVVR